MRKCPSSPVLFYTFETNNFSRSGHYKDYIDELINKISLGRFSRAKVKTAPSANMKMIARNIFPMYTKLITGCDDTALSDGCDPPKLCKVNNKA